ncbi:Protein of unknown function DUF2339, transmembrane (plasmid) [Gemmatirosa kalamazoonensis]|uniref:DUF2339 domain-containing protein n=1 Tax=Gemmatirosa kalamazoonensis TaxID=861299 RepID=W0RNQ5_9BACT|nr:DUF2339 domain-containing protein [Gemmatirosa kalamazoonensis]AHG92371.1 Protein of unknown function DUF2339, transmembrane [Gemmatirosa kalamazoonensis]
MTDDDRLSRLEQSVEELRREIAALRAERERPRDALRDALRDAPREPPITRAAAPPPIARYAPRRSAGEWLAGQMEGLGLGTLPHDRADVEAIVGRYGTVALAALLILMGVGAFLTWAIANYTIGPGTRVALGVVLAAALGALGWRVRRGDAHEGRRYGDVLLALALAVVHVDAWGAGPYLGLLSPGPALAIAAIASAGLALLAWHERDQPLFVVGVGGALVAPYVTSAGPGHPYVLPLYGWVVLTSGALALPRERRWAFATRLLGIGAAAYTAAMLAPATAGLALAPPRGEVPVLFALATAAAALVVGGPVAAPWLALAHVTTTAGGVIALALDASSGAPRLPLLAAVGDALGYAALWRAVREARRAAPTDPRTDIRTSTTALLLPLALLLGALVALPDAVSDAGAAVGAAWAALAIVAALLGARTVPNGDDPLLGAHAAVAGFASALVPALLLRDRGVARVAGLAAHGALCAAVFARVRRRVAVLPSLTSLAAAAGGAYLLLWERPAFAYTPFLTSASLAAATVVAGCIALAWLAWRTPVLTLGERGALAALAAMVALLWGREELARAPCRTTSRRSCSSATSRRRGSSRSSPAACAASRRRARPGSRSRCTPR